MSRHNTETRNSYRLLRPHEVEETYGLKKTVLERMRRSGKGPCFLKTGEGRTAFIYYRIADLEAWIESRVQQ